MKTKRPTAEDVRQKILSDISAAKERMVRIRSGDVAADMDAERSTCSSAMKTLFRSGDQISELPKGRPAQKGISFETQTGGQNYAGGNLVILYVRRTDRSQPRMARD